MFVKYGQGTSVTSLLFLDSSKIGNNYTQLCGAAQQMHEAQVVLTMEHVAFCQHQNPLKCQYKLHSITSRKTAIFMVTATRTSNLPPFITFCLRSTCDTHTHCGTSAVPLTLELQKSRLSCVDCGVDIQGIDCCRQI